MSLGYLSLVNAPQATATHYRANQVTWHQVSGNTVEFHIDGSWRCSYFFDDPCDAVIGETFEPDSLDFGDGESGAVSITVTGVDVVNDVVTGSAHVEHTYATAGPFVAEINNCCRLSDSGGHINNPDGGVVFQTLIDLTKDSASPESLVAPIVDCPLNAVCNFTVPAVDPNSQPLNWRLATDEEASGSPGGFTQPAGASIGATTGLYSWDTTGAVLADTGSTYYSTQVIVENVVDNAVVSRIPVDFFIRLGSNSTNAQPVFVAPTPADGSVITGTVGTPLTFTATANDPDSGDTVTLGALGAPAGSTFVGSPANPASSTFTWTPSGTGDTLLTLVASDQNGLGAVPRGIILRVSAGTNPPPVVDAGPPVSGAEGAAIAIVGTATDTDALTTAWSATPGAGVDAGASCTFANAAALSTTVTCTDDGDWTLTLSATDTSNPAVTDTTALTVTNAVPAVSISAPASGSTVNVGASVALTSPFTDAGSNDTHTCSVDWGDGATTPGVVASGTCSASHSYAAAGGFTITVTVTDDDTGAGTATAAVTAAAATSAGYIYGWGSTAAPRCARVYFAVAASGTPLTGDLQVASGRNWFDARGVSAITVTGNTSTWSGSGRWNGKSGYTFTATFEDNRKLSFKKKKGPADTFAITIRNAAGVVVFSSSGAVKDGVIAIK